MICKSSPAAAGMGFASSRGYGRHRTAGRRLRPTARPQLGRQGRVHAMTIDDVIRDFADADGTLPRAAMQWALDNWEVAGPRFIELVDRYPREIDRSTAMEDALFFAIHLLGEKRETRAFGALCRLLHK